VRYIHLNPLRVRLVESLDQLDCYPYGGHSALMGKCPNDWQDVDTILSLFGRRASSARSAYRSFVEKAVAVGRRLELTGGGLIRSAGGWGALKSLGKGAAAGSGQKPCLLLGGPGTGHDDRGGVKSNVAVTKKHYAEHDMGVLKKVVDNVRAMK